MRYMANSAYSKLFPEDDKKGKKANAFVNRLSEKTINWLYDTMCVNKNLNATLEDKKDFVFYAKYENLRNNVKFSFKRDSKFKKLTEYYKELNKTNFVNQNGPKFTVTEK